MFYLYRQNNSGGKYIKNQKIGEFVIIEENNMQIANNKAISLGIYFNGVYKCIDCDCCGDRWSSEPEQYNTVADLINNNYEFNIRNCPIYLYNFSMEQTIIINEEE